MDCLKRRNETKDSSQENANDDEHQANDRQKQRSEVYWDDLLDRGTHFLIAQASAFGAADSQDAPNQTCKTCQRQGGADPNDEFQNRSAFGFHGAKRYLNPVHVASPACGAAAGRVVKPQNQIEAGELL